MYCGYNNFLPKQLLNKFLCCYPGCLPVNNTHYLTGKNIKVFSDIMCIEKQLTCFTSCCNNLCNNFKNNFRM